MNFFLSRVGVGFDTKGGKTISVKGPSPSKPPEIYVIADSREGWVHSLKLLLDSYFLGGPQVVKKENI